MIDMDNINLRLAELREQFEIDKQRLDEILVETNRLSHEAEEIAHRTDATTSELKELMRVVLGVIST